MAQAKVRFKDLISFLKSIGWLPQIAGLNEAVSEVSASVFGWGYLAELVDTDREAMRASPPSYM